MSIAFQPVGVCSPQSLLPARMSTVMSAEIAVSALIARFRLSECRRKAAKTYTVRAGVVRVFGGQLTKCYLIHNPKEKRGAILFSRKTEFWILHFSLLQQCLRAPGNEICTPSKRR